MTSAFKFGTRSEANLVGVHPDHVRVVRRALALSNVDFAVAEGVRPAERQAKLYAQGRTNPGEIVTWTRHSKHEIQIDGNGWAVDLVPVNPKKKAIDWGYSGGFAEIKRAMFAAAEELQQGIRWGGDWNRNGIEHEKGETDSPHFERFDPIARAIA